MDPRAYLKVELGLTRRLQRAWLPIATRVFTRVGTAIDRKDWAGAYDAASELDLEPVALAEREHIKASFLAAAYIGASMVHDNPEVMDENLDGVIIPAANQLALSLEREVMQSAYKQLLQLIAENQKERVFKAGYLKGKRFAKDFVSFKEDGDAHLQLLASLHSSRMAVWGFTGEAFVRGVYTYRLTAVLDGRTSDYCRYIAHGKIFRVEDARRSINTILQAQDPQDLKTLQPWPKQDKANIAELKVFTPAELTARGFHIPPFHPRCRTLCALVDKKYVGERTKPVELPIAPLEVQTQQSFKVFGQSPRPKLLDLWNQVVRFSPIVLLGRLTGIPWGELLEKKWPNVFRPVADDSIKIVIDDVIDGVEAEIITTYNPSQSSLAITKYKFNGKLKASDDFLKNMFYRTVNVAEDLEADRVTVLARGNVSLLQFAKMGFVPTAAEWANLQLEIEDAHANLSKDVRSILSSPDPKGIWALALIAPELLEGKNARMVLDVNDPEALAIFEGAL